MGAPGNGRAAATSATASAFAAAFRASDDEPPSEREPGGVLFEASYTVQDTGPGTGALTVSDFQGRLIGKTDIRTGDDADAAARRVVLREKGSPSVASAALPSGGQGHLSPGRFPFGRGGFFICSLGR